MPANKYALIRYRVIDECLTNRFRPYPTKEDLRRACEDALYGSQNQRVSVSTIEKDLFAMRNDVSLGFEAPIEFHKGEKGYFYTDEKYTIKKVPLQEEDLEALWFASQTLYQFRDIPVFQAFESMIGKLREHVSLSDNEFDTGFMDHMLFDDSHKGQGDRYIPEILKAIRDLNILQIEYAFHDENKREKWYEIEPILLKQFRLRWYVIGRDTEAQKIKTYGLDRIQRIKTTDRRFIHSDFNPKEYFKDTFGISHIEKEKEEVLLKVDKRVSKYLLAAPMHPSMRSIEENEDHVLIAMDIVVNIDLINEMMTWMPNIQVLSPPSLRDEVLRRCEEAVKLNSVAT